MLDAPAPRIRRAPTSIWALTSKDEDTSRADIENYWKSKFMLSPLSLTFSWLKSAPPCLTDAFTHEQMKAAVFGYSSEESRVCFKAEKHRDRSGRAGQDSGRADAAWNPGLKWGIWLLGWSQAGNCLTGHHWQRHPNSLMLPVLSAPRHHAAEAPTSWCISNISSSVIPKPSPEIYLPVEVENEYFTVHLPDQLPTSCC